MLAPRVILRHTWGVIHSYNLRKWWNVTYQGPFPRYIKLDNADIGKYHRVVRGYQLQQSDDIEKLLDPQYRAHARRCQRHDRHPFAGLLLAIAIGVPVITWLNAGHAPLTSLHSDLLLVAVMALLFVAGFYPTMYVMKHGNVYVAYSRLFDKHADGSEDFAPCETFQEKELYYYGSSAVPDVVRHSVNDLLDTMTKRKE